MAKRRAPGFVSSYYREIGGRLRVTREELGFSQDKVARLLGLHRPIVSKIEGGSRKLGVLELVLFCQLYKRQPADFIFGVPVENNHT